MIGTVISALIKPKSLIAIGLGLSIIAAGFVIRKEIKDYGSAQRELGRVEVREAVAAKAKETKAKLDKEFAAAVKEASKTEIVYVDVIKKVIVADATVVTENEALKYQLDLIYERIDKNETITQGACAVEPIPDSSVSVHRDVDRLLSGD